ncbi:outer membrane protein [Bartonella sp. B23]
MNIKSLITTSVIALVSVSAAQAADVIVSNEAVPAVVTAPAFSWTGFYLGAQVGNFSSKSEIKVPGANGSPFAKDDTPKLSGFIGGVYAGSNIELGNGFIFGVETDAVWSGREETKTRNKRVLLSPLDAHDLNGLFASSSTTASNAEFRPDDIVEDHNTYKEKWSGATRVRVGFATDRFMPYVSGGISYAQLQGIHSVIGSRNVDGKAETVSRGNLYDETKMMVGYTLGGGLDFAMSNNVMLRAEYRHSDFGKKKFANDTQEFNYKTNDFRVGVAYKF